MANFNPYTVTSGSAATVTVQQYTIDTAVTDDDNNVIADFTGANALIWPTMLNALSQQQRDDLMHDLGQQVAAILAGVTQ